MAGDSDEYSQLQHPHFASSSVSEMNGDRYGGGGDDMHHRGRIRAKGSKRMNKRTAALFAATIAGGGLFYALKSS